MVLSLSLPPPGLLYSLFFSLSASLSLGRRFKRPFSQVMWSTFVCSNLTKECLAFTRLCLHWAVKENEKKKLVKEEGKGERKKQKKSEFKAHEEQVKERVKKTNRKGTIKTFKNQATDRKHEGMGSECQGKGSFSFSHALDKTRGL